MGLSQTSVLAFVIDTTGSLSNYIAEAKRVSISIIDSRRGTSEEPSEYILLTLTRAPPSSDIFVFTDASAKDTELKSSAEAMIESTKSKVTFLLTNSTSTRSRQNVSLSRSLSQSEIQLYRDLAHVSGGQTIDVINTTLSQATAVITDLITADLVTVLQAARNPPKAENFSFLLDLTLSNVTVYITGDSPVFTLYSPT
ncbi:von Willebrand factor A domain-containing protein 7-like, partial [Sinocyclocheilus anshuiensis]|uniref:von Willebrand factor A domain-containing protein 7-like n=1 Tax=Sinocyclocheilus anshuiensis TaxID=1608454 RepID=UPI0007B84325